MDQEPTSEAPARPARPWWERPLVALSLTSFALLGALPVAALAAGIVFLVLVGLALEAGVPEARLFASPASAIVLGAVGLGAGLLSVAAARVRTPPHSGWVAFLSAWGTVCAGVLIHFAVGKSPAEALPLALVVLALGPVALLFLSWALQLVTWLWRLSDTSRFAAGVVVTLGMSSVLDAAVAIAPIVTGQEPERAPAVLAASTQAYASLSRRATTAPPARPADTGAAVAGLGDVFGASGGGGGAGGFDACVEQVRGLACDGPAKVRRAYSHDSEIDDHIHDALLYVCAPGKVPSVQWCGAFINKVSHLVSNRARDRRKFDSKDPVPVLESESCPYFRTPLRFDDLYKALDTLPSRDQRILRAAYGLELTDREIGERMGLSDHRVRFLRRAAEKQLAAALQTCDWRADLE